MRFKLLKSGFDGISGGESDYPSIDAVLHEIVYFRGWNSLEELHASIRKWAKQVRAGDVFCTQGSVIVATTSSFEDEDMCPHCGLDGMDYEELSPTEGGIIEQSVKCPGCGERWVDIFSLTGRRSLPCED